MPVGRRAGLAAYAALVAASAYAGAIGLATGGLDTSGAIDDRLPFHSPVFGGFALTVVVGVPTSALAWCAWRGDRRTGAVATLAGAVLVGWIVVELMFIRELSWLHPVYIIVGATLVGLGRRVSHEFRGNRAALRS